MSLPLRSAIPLTMRSSATLPLTVWVKILSAAAEAAVAAAERILTHTVKGKVADDLIVKGIADLKGKLN